MVKQTAGRDALNDFAPKFAELNDDVLFGEVWSREGSPGPVFRNSYASPPPSCVRSPP